jgi:FtsZ-binding cell division protein ZapB
MLETALPKLEQLIEQLLVKNQSLQQDVANLNQQNEQLQSQLKQVSDDSETLQLEALEQEEQHSATLDKINTLLNRLEQEV